MSRTRNSTHSQTRQNSPRCTHSPSRRCCQPRSSSPPLRTRSGARCRRCNMNRRGRTRPQGSHFPLHSSGRSRQCTARRTCPQCRTRRGRSTPPCTARRLRSPPDTTNQQRCSSAAAHCHPGMRIRWGTRHPRRCCCSCRSKIRSRSCRQARAPRRRRSSCLPGTARLPLRRSAEDSSSPAPSCTAPRPRSHLRRTNSRGTRRPPRIRSQPRSSTLPRRCRASPGPCPPCTHCLRDTAHRPLQSSRAGNNDPRNPCRELRLLSHQCSNNLGGMRRHSSRSQQDSLCRARPCKPSAAQSHQCRMSPEGTESRRSIHQLGRTGQRCRRKAQVQRQLPRTHTRPDTEARSGTRTRSSRPPPRRTMRR